MKTLKSPKRMPKEMLIESSILRDKDLEYVDEEINLIIFWSKILIEHRVNLLIIQHEVWDHTLIFEQIVGFITTKKSLISAPNHELESLEKVKEELNNRLEELIKKGDGPNGTLLDELMTIRFDTKWDSRDISQMHEAIKGVAEEFERLKFKVEWVDGPDEEVMKLLCDNFDDFHGFPRKENK